VAHLLDLVPQGKQYDILRFMLRRLEKDFPRDFKGLENQTQRITDWITEIDSGTGRDADQIRDDIVRFIIGEEAAIAKYGITAEQFQQLILGGNEGGINFGDLKGLTSTKPVEGGITDPDPKTLPGVLAGGELIKVTVSGEDRFYQIFEFPPGSGSFISYQFNDLNQVKATFGELPAFTVRTENWFDTQVLAEAPAEEVIGLGGNFSKFVDEIMKDAATAAGVLDPGLIGKIASNKEMQEIMAQAIVGEWTQAQILAAQRQTIFWKEELYPGIERFYGKTSTPETDWLEYTAGVTPALRALGYEEDADGTFNSQIKNMLDRDIDAQTFLSQVPTFLLATQNSEFATILNEWTLRDLDKEVTFQDWFDLLEGNSTIEIEQVAENARLAWVSANQGTDLSNEEIAALALRTELGNAQAAAAFSEVNQAMLALGTLGLERGGLTRDDIISSAAGVSPESGRSVDEVRLLIGKLARENDLFDEEKLSFFVGFDPLGRPNRPGLKAIAPEGA
jgi:hypothetical protein